MRRATRAPLKAALNSAHADVLAKRRVTLGLPAGLRSTSVCCFAFGTFDSTTCMRICQSGCKKVREQETKTRLLPGATRMR